MSEESEAKRDGATLQKNSGRGKHQKGDAVLDDFMIDYKEYTGSFTMSASVLGKLNRDAMTCGKTGVLKIILLDDNGNAIERRFDVPEFVFHDYIEMVRSVRLIQANEPDVYKTYFEGL